MKTLMAGPGLYDKTTATRWKALQDNGHMVKLYRENVAAEANDWCALHCKGDYAWSGESRLIDDATYQLSVDVADGKTPNPSYDSNWREMQMSNMFARELEKEINHEILREIGWRVPTCFFWLENDDDAVLFKLTFGGD